MTTITVAAPIRSRHSHAVPARSQTSRLRAALMPQGQAPFCSLKARPAPQPAPAPSWEELLGQR